MVYGLFKFVLLISRVLYISLVSECVWNVNKGMHGGWVGCDLRC